MKTSELIAKLREADPSGEKLVVVDCEPSGFPMMHDVFDVHEGYSHAEGGGGWDTISQARYNPALPTVRITMRHSQRVDALWFADDDEDEFIDTQS